MAHPPGNNSGGSPLRVTKRRGQTRSRLLAAAAGVFAEQGFGRATVEDVCERAGYTRAAFYSNFSSLDELFLALHTDRAAALIQAMENAVTAAVAEPGAAGENSGPPLDAVVDRVITALPVSQDYHLLNIEFAVHALRHPERRRIRSSSRSSWPSSSSCRWPRSACGSAITLTSSPSAGSSCCWAAGAAAPHDGDLAAELARGRGRDADQQFAIRNADHQPMRPADDLPVDLPWL